MSVLNSASSLMATLDSILSQDGVNYEVLVVDDGSNDGSGDILNDYSSRFDRVKVLRQENAGLTRALIRGCECAQSDFIARHDAGGDVSLPGRLVHQLAFLRAQPEAVMTACGARFVGPQGEPLYEVCQNYRELHDQLRARSIGALRGPSHHGAVMFRKDAYRRAGGYRSSFSVAQDLDLWNRMAETGLCLATPNIFYQANLSKGSISNLYRDRQIQATRIIIECAEARRNGYDESAILAKLADIQAPRKSIVAERVHDARFYYFVGSILRRRDSRHANAYFRRALTRWPLHSRAWFGFLRSFRLH